MTSGGQKSWIILRTSGTGTLQLAKALREAGMDAWSPVEIQNRRRPRSNDRFEREVAVMPSYVFANAEHLVELLQIASKPQQCYKRWDAELRRMVVQGIPHFSVFHHNNGIPLIADDGLNALRVVERRTAPKPVAPTFATGQAVKLSEGGFAGLSGTVQSSKGDFAMVAFAGYPIAIKISLLLLHPDMIDSAQPGIGIAAQAA